jgi:hypothetical protein
MTFVFWVLLVSMGVFVSNNRITNLYFGTQLPRNSKSFHRALLNMCHLIQIIFGIYMDLGMTMLEITIK